MSVLKMSKENENIISFSGIYDPEEDSPAIMVLIEDWKKEFTEAMAGRVMDGLKDKKSNDNNKL